MSGLDAILLDIGGTLDGRGGWRDRFHRLLAAGVPTTSHADRVSAFDYAEARSHVSPEMATCGLRDMLTRHVAWQLESLAIDSPIVASEIVERFARDVDDATLVNRRVLADLAARGLRLGVVSNACGNAARLCEEYGYAGMLAVIVDSHEFGASKPDAAIFQHALRLLDVSPDRAGFVGDSLDRDITPAKALGMRTFWISNGRPAPASRDADVILDSLAELPASLLQLELRAV